MSTVHDLRLLPVAAAVWTAALLTTAGAAVPTLVSGVGIAAASLTVLAFTHAGRGRDGTRCTGWRGSSHVRTTAAACLLMGVAVAVVAIVGGTRHDAEMERGEELVSTGRIDAWVTIDGQPSVMRALDGSDRWRVTATVTAWRPHCARQSDCEGWTVGPVPVAAVLETPPNRGAVMQLEAAWEASGRGPEVAIAWQAQAAEATGGVPTSLVMDWRERFTQATHHLDPSVRGLVRGMAIGDTTSMPTSQERDMRVASLAHLTAVSGAHFAILVMTSVSILGAVRAPRVVRASVVLLVAGVFAAVVGPEASVLRALAMAVSVALALAWGRPARGSAALWAGVIVLVMLDPWLARSIGFAMSVLAVAAIVLWSPRVAALGARAVTPALARVIAIPIVAQAAVTPLLVVIEPGIGPYGVVANVLAGLMVLPTMLACAAALAAAAVSVPVASVLPEPAGLFAHGIAYVARGIADMPGSWLGWPAGIVGVTLSTVVTVLLVVASLPMRVQWRLAACVCALSLLGIGLSLAAPARSSVPANWEVAACDVGQGDMLLLRAGPDAAVVVDTGPPDSGADDCLLRHRIGHIPLLILTHPHQDHDGAVSDVARVADIDQAWVTAAGQGETAAAIAAAAGAPVTVPAEGQQFEAGDVTLTVESALHKHVDVQANDASIVVRAQAGGTSVIALGDLEVDGQRALLARLDQAEAVDVVKVAHHGSAQQLPALVERLAATVALVSAGAGNRHGHPTTSALELYGEHATAVLRTDICGDLHVSRHTGRLNWSRCP